MGNQYNNVEEKEKAQVNDAYTIGCNVVHDGKQWKKNKRKEVFVTPELKKNKWVGDVDEMYIGAHLVNEFQGTEKNQPMLLLVISLKFTACNISQLERNSL